jgi:hypothetical protein
MTIRAFRAELTPEGSIAGRVVDPEGQPVEGVKVRASKPRVSESRYTNDRGEFRIDRLPPGRYELEAAPGRTVLPPEVRTDGTREEFLGDATYPGRLELRPGGELAGVEIRLERARRVRVSGVLTGAAAGEMRIEAERVGDRDFTRPAIVKGGTWEIWNLTPGKYRVGARAGSAQSATEEIEVGATDVDGIELTLMEPFEISGRVEWDGPPMAQLALAAPSPRRSAVVVRVLPDGSFHATARPERYTIAAVGAFATAVYLGPTEMRDGILDLSRGAGAPIVIRLAKPSGKISGTVRDAKVPVVVTLERVSRPEFRREVETAASFAFDSLPRGVYRLVVDDEVETVEIGDGERVVRDLKLPR